MESSAGPQPTGIECNVVTTQFFARFDVAAGIRCLTIVEAFLLRKFSEPRDTRGDCAYAGG